MAFVRHKALGVAASYVNKAFESGQNNRGPLVDKFQQADDLPGGGYAWCASFVQFCFKEAGHPLPSRSASVGKVLEDARKRGWVVSRPFAGDLVCFHFDTDSWPDHIGFVEKVISLGPVLVIQTIEGNTGPSGSVSDPGTGRDGVYRKRRVVRASKVAFIRVPYKLTQPTPAPKPVVRRTPRFEIRADGKVKIAGLKSRRQAMEVAEQATYYHREVVIRKTLV